MYLIGTVRGAQEHGQPKGLGTVFVCAVAVLLLSLPSWASEGTYLSPIAVVRDTNNDKLFIAEFTGKKISVLDTSENQIIKKYRLSGRPTGLALSPDGRKLYVTLSKQDANICVIDLETESVSDMLTAGHTPYSPVITPDGTKLYVCNRFSSSVSVLDLHSFKQIKDIPVVREPVSAALTPDAKLLFVTNLLPANPATADHVAAVVSVIDTTEDVVETTIRLPNGSTNLRDMCVSPDGKFAYATSTLGHYNVPTTQLERGWINTSALHVIDVARLELLTTILLDNVDQGAANPWALKCTPDGRYLCITHAGTGELSIIDRSKLHGKISEYGQQALISDVPNDLTFLNGVRRRVKLSGKGPRGMAISGNRAYIAEYFSDSIAVVEFKPKGKYTASSIRLQDKSKLTPRRRGEILFHDATLSFQNWQSCSSCHPDGRADGLNWDLLNDGIGTPKNTKSLLLTPETPPVMITGTRKDVETAIRAGIRHILFTQCSDGDVSAIKAYLESLTPVPSPRLIKGQLSESAERGKEVFEKADCARCHTSPLLTDLKQYNVRTGKGSEQQLAMDTPTLVEVWRTSPYLCDGSAATIKEVLTTHNNGDEHGQTSSLSEQELTDLAEFILSQ